MMDLIYDRILIGRAKRDGSPITNFLGQFDEIKSPILDQVLDRVGHLTKKYPTLGMDAAIEMNDSWDSVTHEEPGAWQLARGAEPLSISEPEWTEAQQWSFGGAVKRRKRWWPPW